MAAFIAPIISGLAGLFGGFKKPSTQTNTSTTEGVSSPELSANQNLLSDTFTQALLKRFNTDTDLSRYSAGGLQEINRAGDARSKIINNLIASRGLSFSPAATTAQIGNENERLRGSTDFLNTIPLLARQLKGQDISELIRGFSALPTASRTSSTTKQSGTSLVPGNPIAGALGGFGAGLFAPYNGNFDTPLGDIINRFFKPQGTYDGGAP